MNFGAICVLIALVVAAFGALTSFALSQNGDARGLRFGVYAAIGFFACMAAATARLRPRLAAGVVSVPVTAVRVRSWRRIAYLLLLLAVLAAAVFLAVISGVSGR